MFYQNIWIIFLEYYFFTYFDRCNITVSEEKSFETRKISEMKFCKRDMK